MASFSEGEFLCIAGRNILDCGLRLCAKAFFKPKPKLLKQCSDCIKIFFNINK
jgi:hypothetical protein